jgi:hypothetical protein
MFEYNEQNFLTDNDLDVKVLGRWPEIKIKNKNLLKIVKKESGRKNLGGDEIISFSQQLVAGGMDFDDLQQRILESTVGDKTLAETVFDKTSTGIGRGHSLGGLSGIMLGLHGTKMIDSGLTGLASSRSLVTSGRRRTVKEEDIIIPESITRKGNLLKEYLEISRAAFKEAEKFKDQIGKMQGVETFNKSLAYNNPGDLIIVLPLDTMATLAFEVEDDKLNPKGPFIPREIHKLVEMFPDLAKEVGIEIMYKQRIQVPRDGYFHYTVFKDPSIGSSALEMGEELGMPIEPVLINSYINLSRGFKKGLKHLEELFERTRLITDPAELHQAAINCMNKTKAFVAEYNGNASAKIADSLSLRVWSEQKRHATLRQHVESIYTAAPRAAREIQKFWSQIEAAYIKPGSEELPIEEIERIIVIDKRLKNQPELLVPYVYHSARQLIFFEKLVREGIPMRDAAYVIPRDTRLRTSEDYDLINMIDSELPLRTCKTCEPERYMTSWQKRDLIAKAMPALKYFLEPKCNVGYCTEKTHCKHITDIREYDSEIHKATKAAMLDRAR